MLRMWLIYACNHRSHCERYAVIWMWRDKKMKWSCCSVCSLRYWHSATDTSNCAFTYFQLHKIEIFRFTWIFFGWWCVLFFISSRLFSHHHHHQHHLVLFTFKHKLIWIIRLYSMNKLNKYWYSLSFDMIRYRNQRIWYHDVHFDVTHILLLCSIAHTCFKWA